MATEENNKRMMTFSTPGPATLKAWGLVAVRRGALEHILKMTIKSLTGVSVADALDATAFEGLATRARICTETRKPPISGPVRFEKQVYPNEWSVSVVLS